MSDVIIIENVTKKFKETNVLSNINVSFSKGKIHGLIGRNGSGKTMLMKCICGLVPATSGKITVNGKVVGKDIEIPENIGVIIENPGFISSYSAYQNLYFLSRITSKIGKNEIRNAIQSVGLDPDNKKHVGKYSLGMRQRLGLAQAIME
ncbi:MAG: ATP-binding cassette domain-containing protein, partial [Ruminococcus flavefaciens]|nr:ATP-binding cassette domain-containing protein [Ruminococcus flavefaciens]